MSVHLLDRPSDPTALDDGVFYPSSDGEPMGETGIHVRAIAYLYHALRVLFGHRNDIYIAADMFLYYERGNPRAVKAPDILMAKGVRGNHERDSFMTWIEGVVPALIFEITSPSTWSEDPGAKKQLYERLGVHECFIFDPLEELLDDSLQGYRLVDGRYQPISPNADGTFTSQEINAKLRRDGILLRVVDPVTGEMILWEGEVVARLRELEQRAEQEHRRALLAARRAAREARRAEEEARRAEEETRRAEEETRRAELAEAENARLRALLAGLNLEQSDQN